MTKKIPKYPFNSTQNIAFELTSIQAILKKSTAKISKPHRQGFFGLYYFTNSYGKHFVDFKEYTIHKGDLFFISEEQVHHFNAIEKTTGNVLLFTNSFLDNDFLIEKIFEQNIGNPVLALNSEIKIVFNRLITQIKAIYTSDKRIKTTILQKYLEIILLEISEHNQTKDTIQNINYQRFIQLKRDLKNHFSQHKNVKFYAEKQFISTKTLNLAVREIVDKSAKQYISSYVILLAKRMLINTNNTTSQIAFELGFEEPTNFIKFFKNIEKKSPLMFQKEHK